MVRILNILVWISVLCAVTTCGGGGDGGGGAGGGNDDSQGGSYTENTVVLSDLVSGSTKAPGVSAAPSQAPAPPQDCTYISDIYSATGTCITPIKVTGYAEQGHLLKENGSVGGGTRILGQSEFDETPGAIFESEEFDLSNPIPLVTNNTLREQYSIREVYDTISLSTAYYRIQFPVTINTGTKYVTMLLAKYGQPFASSEAVTNAIAECGLDPQETTASRFQNADLLPGFTFNRGDYLFCVKDNETDACAAADYQWLDTSNNTLVSTRPASPKAAHSLANSPIECQNEGGGRVTFNFGPFGMNALIESTSSFKLWSDFTHGSHSNQWPGEGAPMGDESIITSGVAWFTPYYIYYYQDCPSGSCGSTVQEGVDLEVTLQFNTEGMILVEDLDPDAIAAQTNIGDVLLNVHTKTQWAFDQKSENNVVGYDAKDMAGFTVQPVIELTGAPTTPPEGATIYCDEVSDPTQLPDHCP